MGANEVCLNCFKTDCVPRIAEDLACHRPSDLVSGSDSLVWNDEHNQTGLHLKCLPTQ